MWKGKFQSALTDSSSLLLRSLPSSPLHFHCTNTSTRNIRKQQLRIALTRGYKSETNQKSNTAVVESLSPPSASSSSSSSSSNNTATITTTTSSSGAVPEVLGSKFRMTKGRDVAYSKAHNEINTSMGKEVGRRKKDYFLKNNKKQQGQHNQKEGQKLATNSESKTSKEFDLKTGLTEAKDFSSRLKECNFFGAKKETSEFHSGALQASRMTSKVVKRDSMYYSRTIYTFLSQKNVLAAKMKMHECHQEKILSADVFNVVLARVADYGLGSHFEKGVLLMKKWNIKPDEKTLLLRAKCLQRRQTLWERKTPVDGATVSAVFESDRLAASESLLDGASRDVGSNAGSSARMRRATSSGSPLNCFAPMPPLSERETEVETKRNRLRMGFSPEEYPLFDYKDFYDRDVKESIAAYVEGTKSFGRGSGYNLGKYMIKTAVNSAYPECVVGVMCFLREHSHPLSSMDFEYAAYALFQTGRLEFALQYIKLLEKYIEVWAKKDSAYLSKALEYLVRACVMRTTQDAQFNRLMNLNMGYDRFLPEDIEVTRMYDIQRLCEHAVKRNWGYIDNTAGRADDEVNSVKRKPIYQYSPLYISGIFSLTRNVLRTVEEQLVKHPEWATGSILRPLVSCKVHMGMSPDLEEIQELYKKFSVEFVLRDYANWFGLSVEKANFRQIQESIVNYFPNLKDVRNLIRKDRKQIFPTLNKATAFNRALDDCVDGLNPREYNYAMETLLRLTLKHQISIPSHVSTVEMILKRAVRSSKANPANEKKPGLENQKHRNLSWGLSEAVRKAARQSPALRKKVNPLLGQVPVGDSLVDKATSDRNTKDSDEIPRIPGFAVGVGKPDFTSKTWTDSGRSSIQFNVPVTELNSQKLESGQNMEGKHPIDQHEYGNTFNDALKDSYKGEEEAPSGIFKDPGYEKMEAESDLAQAQELLKLYSSNQKTSAQ
eukprot:Nk52_evm5s514 gene=Nk52_evmTU5s514